MTNKSNNLKATGRPGLVLILLACGLIASAVAQTVSITNYVVVGDYKYATLSNSGQSTGSTSCQSNFIQPSDGWTLADSTPANREAMASLASRNFGFSAACLAFSNGDAFQVATGPGPLVTSCGSNVITESSGSFKIANCASDIQIVIRKPIAYGCCDLATKPENQYPDYQSIVCCNDMTWKVRPRGALCNVCGGSGGCENTDLVNGGSGTSCPADVESYGSCTGAGCTCAYGWTGSICNVKPTNAAPSNTKEYHGRVFGTLSNAPATGAAAGQGSNWLRLPDGWKLAADSNMNARGALENSAVGSQTTWSSDCAVLDGASYNVNTLGACANGGFHNEFGHYMPVSATSAIIIVQDGAPGDVEVRVEDVTNFITRGNRLYATINNDGFFGAEGVSAVAFAALPTGWAIATEDADTLAALAEHQPAGPWNAGVLAVAGGRGYSYIAGVATAVDTAAIASIGGYHRLDAAGSILITKEDTRQVIAGCTNGLISKITSFNGHTYATLDNADPSGTTAGCQSTPYRVPEGWSVAPNTPMHRAARASLPWSATCIAFADGKAYDRDLKVCGDALGLTTTTDAEGTCAMPTLPPSTCCNAADEPSVNAQYESTRCCADGTWVVQPNAAMCDVCICGSTNHGPKQTSNFLCADPPVPPACAADTRVLIVKAQTEFLGSLLDNGNFVVDANDATAAAGWTKHGGFGYTFDGTTPSLDGTSGSIKVVITDVYNGGNSGWVNGGAYQVIPGGRLPKDYAQLGFKVTCSSKAESVSDHTHWTQAQYYAIYADIDYVDGTTSYYNYAPFSTGTHGWEASSLDVLPLKAVKEMRVYLLFKGHTGTVWFDGCSVGPSDGNYVTPSFSDPRWIMAGETDISVAGQIRLESTYAPPPPPPPPTGTPPPPNGSPSPPTSPPSSSGGSVRRLLATESYDTSATYAVYLQANEASTYTKIVASVDVKSNGYTITGAYPPSPSDIALYVDIQFQDGTSLFKQTVNVRGGGAYDWELLEAMYPVSRAIAWVRMSLVIRRVQGSIEFRNPSLQLIATDEASVVAAGDVAPPIAYGDPHLVTHDGHKYDFMAAGEFVLSADKDVAVQTRLTPSGKASVISAVAVSFRGMLEVAMECGKDAAPTIWINRQVVGVPAEGGQLALPSGQGRIRRVPKEAGSWAASRFVIDFYATGHRVSVNVFTTGLEWGTTYMTVIPRLPLKPRGPVHGLLGNADGNPWNDLMFAGESFFEGADASHEELYGVFADHHRLVDATAANDRGPNGDFARVSHFVYPAGKGTADYTDRSFYKVPVTLDSFTVEQRAAAEAACADVRGAEFRANCVMDVLLTGDAKFADGAREGDADTTRVNESYEERREADKKWYEAGAAAAAAVGAQPSAAEAPLNGSLGIYFGAVLLAVVLLLPCAYLAYYRTAKRDASPFAARDEEAAGAADVTLDKVASLPKISNSRNNSRISVGVEKAVKSLSKSVMGDDSGNYSRVDA